MNRIVKKVTDLIGSTPLLELTSLNYLPVKIIAKLEYFNPGGSVKDRVALSMVEAAEKEGALKKGGTIIAPTSGNTGIGLALVAATKGYKSITTMPDSMSQERISLLKGLGSKVMLTPGVKGMSGAIDLALDLEKELPNSVVMHQFENQVNPKTHELTTGEEIWRDTEGKIDVFVAGVGTGGTVSGVGRALKKHNPSIEIVAVEPMGSPVLSGGKAGAHGQQGIGAGFVPATYHSDVVDKVVTIKDDEAIHTARELAINEGVLVGISSGTALAAAKKLGELPEYRGKNIVVLLPDGGERYLTTKLFDFTE